MKNDIIYCVSATIVGLVASYFITGMFAPAAEDFTFSNLNNPVTSTEIIEPDDSIFNVNAINPTVEVFVGNCVAYDINGNCIEENNQDENIYEEVPETNPDQEGV